MAEARGTQSQWSKFTAIFLKEQRTGYKDWSPSIPWQLCPPTSNHHFPSASTSILDHQYTERGGSAKVGRERGEICGT